MASGFFYDIKAIVDKNSFAEGRRELEKFEQSAVKMAKGITGITAGLIATATISGQVAQSELKVARAVGVASETLSSWKIACNVAGASASGLIGTLSSLENKMQHMKTGQVDMSLAKNLGMMGIGYGEFADMDSESRMRTVFNQADQMEDQKLAATLVGDILGQAGREYYDSLKMSGKSIDSQLEEAKKLNFVSEQNRKEAAVFAAEMRGVKEAGKGIAILLGSEIGAALTPTVRRVKNYLIENRDSIRKGITGIAQVVEAVFNGIGGAINKVSPFVTKMIDNFGGLDKVIVKVGIGFASMKLMQVAGGITSIIRGVNLLKLAVGGIGKGIAAGGLYLLMDDLIHYFGGGNSVIGYVIDNLGKLKEKLKIDFGIDVDKIAGGIKKLGDEVGKFVGTSIKNGLENLKNLAQIIKDLISGDWDKLGEDIKKFIKDWKDGMAELFNMGEVKQTFTDAYAQSQEEGQGKVQSFTNAYDAAARKVPVFGKVYEWAYNASQSMSEYTDQAKPNNKIKDGVISPNGKVTQVSPDDWVFATKHVEDLAAAFMPSNVLNSSTNMNAPANYVINQSFSFAGGARAETVRQQAYRGTSEALKNTINNATRIMQLMPGTR